MSVGTFVEHNLPSLVALAALGFAWDQQRRTLKDGAARQAREFEHEREMKDLDQVRALLDEGVELVHRVREFAVEIDATGKPPTRAKFDVYFAHRKEMYRVATRFQIRLGSGERDEAALLANVARSFLALEEASGTRDWATISAAADEVRDAANAFDAAAARRAPAILPPPRPPRDLGNKLKPVCHRRQPITRPADPTA